MIAIINQDKQNSKGETLYNVQINRVLICQFWHSRDDGLAKCLERASKAVIKNEIDLTEEILSEFYGDE